MVDSIGRAGSPRVSGTKVRDEVSPTPSAPSAKVSPARTDASEFSSGPLPGAIAAALGAARSYGVQMEARARHAVGEFFGEVRSRITQTQNRVAQLDTQRATVTESLAKTQEQIEAHLTQKPAQGRPPQDWVDRMQALQKTRSTLENQRKSLTNQIERAQIEPVGVRGVNGNVSEVGPVLAVVVDNVTGQVFRGNNSPTNSLPENLHPVLRERLAQLDASRTHPSGPGEHAELFALNDALHARDAHYRSQGSSQRVTSADLTSFTLDTAWTSGGPNSRMQPGTQAERCANCTQLTDGVNNLPGDSVRPYEAQPGVEPARPPISRWQGRTVEAAKGGAKSGAVAGFGFAAYDALKDGRLDLQDVKNIAQATGLGAGSGALGGAIEETVARGLNKTVGGAIERGASAVARRVLTAEAAGGAAMTARVAASRLGGAGVAGAIIGAGFSAFDNIRAYQRGEVSGAQAIGRVAGDATVGAGAGMAGAAAGAAIGSIIPGAGTIVGGVIGFGVGVAAGYLADKGLRGLGVDKAIANTVTAAVEKGQELVHDASAAVSSAVNTASKAVSSAVDSGKALLSDAGNLLSGAASSLTSVFGW